MWADSDVEGLLAAFPYLKTFGVSNQRLIYKFDYNGVRFIFLWTGKLDYRSPSSWDATRPAYEEQMTQLRQWLDEAKAAGTRKVFISFHAPAFCRAGMGAIPEPQNPHKVIAAYAKDLDIVVFNGHVHTTELFEVDGVKYLVLGGGGAEQDPIFPGRQSGLGARARAVTWRRLRRSCTGSAWGRRARWSDRRARRALRIRRPCAPWLRGPPSC